MATGSSLVPPDTVQLKASALEHVDQDVNLWHGREAAAQAIRRYSLSSEEARQSGAGQGTVMGVIFPCMANILGVLLFLRLPWIVGKAGILNGFGLVFVCCTCTFVTTLSLAAIATNGRILGGGAYFLISRSLGPALGAGVGLCFYMANSIGAAMYFMGTVEAWEIAQPNTQILTAGDINNIRLTAFCILVVALFTVGAGVKLVAKLGTVFLFIVLGVILCMYIGLFVGPGGESKYDVDFTDPIKVAGLETSKLTLEWSSPSGKHLSDNLKAAFDQEQHAFPADTTEHGFISLMALWFPAVTGIMAGSNRSSDLADPAGSIPKGTLFAQGFTSIVYLSFVVLYGCACPRETLLHDKFFAASSAWPMKEFVMYGVMASTIGAGLTSLLSGTRLLSAIAGDGTLPILRVFAVPPGKEPRLALVASGVLCALAIAIGELNAVAPVLTMFFLMCYTCVNMSCTILVAVHDPNWRPRFRFHHWSISLFGAILCVWMMFAISTVFAMIAIVFCAVIFTYAARNSHQVKWGDGFQGMKFQVARNVLTHMSLTAHTKNWRPQLLVISKASIALKETGDDEEMIVLEDDELFCLASQLKGGRGITIFGGVCTTDGQDIFGDGGLFMGGGGSSKRVLDGQEAMSRLLRKWRIEGFGRVIHTEDYSAGLMSLVQLSGLGAFQPNCVLACWPKDARWKPKTKEAAECRAHLIRLVQVAVVFQKVMLLANGKPFPMLSERLHGNVDIWWIVADGGILLLLPFLLEKHPVWHHCRTRLFAVADPEADDLDAVKVQLETYLRDFRLNIEVHVKVFTPEIEVEVQEAIAQKPQKDAEASSQPIAPVNSVATDKSGAESEPVFTDEEPRRQKSNFSSASGNSGLARWRHPPPQGKTDLPTRQKSKDSFGSSASRQGFPATPPGSIGRQAATPAGLDAVAFNVSKDSGSQVGAGESGLKAQSASSDRAKQFPSSDARDAMFMSTAGQLSSHAPCSVEELSVAMGINALMRRESADSELVVTNLPDMPPNESAFGYFELVEAMTKGLNRTFLVRGTASEVITAFT